MKVEKKVKLKKLSFLINTVYLYSMCDLYKKNRPSGQPMAIKGFESISQNVLLQSMWIDRLITSVYVVLTGTIIAISLAILLGFNG